MVFDATFNNISVSFIGGGNRGTRRKPPTCRKSMTNFYHRMVYTSPWSRFELTTPVVIGTDSIGSSKSNYHIYDHGHDYCTMFYHLYSFFVLSYYVSLRSEFRVVMFFTISVYKRCSVHLQWFVVWCIFTSFMFVCA
jgi:hypothetical protein